MIALYANNIALINSDVAIAPITIPLQAHLRHLWRWYSELSLEMNESESESILITNRESLASEIRVSSKKIAWNSLVNDLKVVFDMGQFWCKQVPNARAKTSGAYIRLKPFFNFKLSKP